MSTNFGAREMLIRMITLGGVLVVVASLSLLAFDNSGLHVPGGSHHMQDDVHQLPLQGGQATFAALIELVAMLEKDAETDWDSVDIDSLRAHLLDMNYLMLGTEATTSILSDAQIQFVVRGTEDSIPSIKRMVPAHSRFIEQSRDWEIMSDLTDVGAVVSISVKEKAHLNRLSALGFYGFMSLDSHHQAHHYQMAIGKIGNSH